MHILDELAKIKFTHREFYGTDRNNKPNDYCNWERLSPTASSEFGWVENDGHFRNRIEKLKQI